VRSAAVGMTESDECVLSQAMRRRVVRPRVREPWRPLPHLATAGTRRPGRSSEVSWGSCQVHRCRRQPRTPRCRPPTVLGTAIGRVRSSTARRHRATAGSAGNTRSAARLGALGAGVNAYPILAAWGNVPSTAHPVAPGAADGRWRLDGGGYNGNKPPRHVVGLAVLACPPPKEQHECEGMGGFTDHVSWPETAETLCPMICHIC